jgi:hypothetical protein
MKFDDEGGVIQEAAAHKASEEGRRYEAEDEDVGGINLAKAKLVLRAEDKYDKLLERERVKARKKEEKRKAKEAKKRRKEAVSVRSRSWPDVSVKVSPKM